jgi:hypothetical protein
MTNAIDKFVSEKARIVGGIKLFMPEDAVQLIAVLAKEDKRVLGIDGIFVSAGSTQPSMEDSFLSSKLYDNISSDAQIAGEITAFIRARANKQHLLFEIIF